MRQARFPKAATSRPCASFVSEDDNMSRTGQIGVVTSAPMKLPLLASWVALSVIVSAQIPARADAVATAKDATWAIAIIRLSANQIDHAAFVGTGFFVSRNHFITAAHVINAKLLGRSRNNADRIRVFKDALSGDGFNALKVIYENEGLDLAILHSPLAAPAWMTISAVEPREGDEVGSYGYPLVEFSDLKRANAFALGRFGMVAGYGRDSGARRMVSTLGSTVGNSGGPVFLMSTGRVVAVHKGQMTDTRANDIEGYSMSTPLAGILPELQKLDIVPH